MRRLLETESEECFKAWQGLRNRFPSLTLLANLGITQIISTPLTQILRLIESLKAHALVIHTNPLQECLQLEGTPHFRGAIDKLKTLCKELKIPLILKETGCGFSLVTLNRLKDIGLAALDISGLGGTHWGRIEGSRSQEINPLDPKAQASKTFENWGEATDQSVRTAKKVLSGIEIWASGGVRSGLDSAKLLALGADRVGYAQPALQAALQSEQALFSWMERQELELKIALFCTGSLNPAQLRAKEGVWTSQEN
jgi:isopentenyl-diphosphate Delta-isomerase